MIFKRNPDSELESRLRSDRPRPDGELVDTIAASVERSVRVVRPRSLRLAFAVASVGILAALAAFGGVSYAANGVEHAAVAVKQLVVPSAQSESTANKPVDVLSSLIPSKTSAGDQYLPPGTTPGQAADRFTAYVIKANEDTSAALPCASLRGAAKAACLGVKTALAAQKLALQARLDAAAAKIKAMSADKQAQVATMLAIHLQQEQALAAAQAARRASCASATYKAAHKAICAKANPLTEARERYKLGHLELAELENLLAALGV